MSCESEFCQSVFCDKIFFYRFSGPCSLVSQSFSFWLLHVWVLRIQPHLSNLAHGIPSYASFLSISFTNRHKLYNSLLKWALHSNDKPSHSTHSDIHKTLMRLLITAACSDCHRQIPGPEGLWSSCHHENIFSPISFIPYHSKQSNWTSSSLSHSVQLKEALPAPCCRSALANKGL